MDAVERSQKILAHWRDIGGWNYYFLFKFALLWAGYLNFHPFMNLVFLAFLLAPLPSLSLHRYRNWIAIPIGIVLLYHDTWLPGFSTIKDQGTNLFSFNPTYLLEIMQRFINWKIVGFAFVLWVGYLFLEQWIRITVFTVLFVIWLNVITLTGPAVDLLPTTKQIATNKGQVKADSLSALNDSLPPTNDNLNAYLNQFYEQQKELHTNFPAVLSADSLPFDILLVQVCSLSWADVDGSKLRDHPLWNKFDILFDNFNSAASYSGPAAIRLLRASCGQTSHTGLYEAVPKECYLLDNLANLGFAPQIMLDHEGLFGDFLKELKEYGGLAHVPLISRSGIPAELISFDQKPITDNAQLFGRWLKESSSNTKRNATYYNEISLHDGNSFIGENASAPYAPRVKKLLDQTMDFFTALEQSGRKAMVVFIPEHGANIVGDKLQIPGLRDIPSPGITHIPVGIKFIGLKGKPESIHIKEPSSYLALSELIARIVDGKIFEQDNVNLATLSKNLPQTVSVSSNDGVTVMKYQDKYYILLKGDSNWVPYP